MHLLTPFIMIELKEFFCKILLFFVEKQQFFVLFFTKTRLGQSSYVREKCANEKSFIITMYGAHQRTATCIAGTL